MAATMNALVAREHNIQSAMCGLLLSLAAHHMPFVFRGAKMGGGPIIPVIKSYPRIVLEDVSILEDIGLATGNFTQMAPITVTVWEAVTEHSPSPPRTPAALEPSFEAEMALLGVYAFLIFLIFCLLSCVASLLTDSPKVKRNLSTYIGGAILVVPCHPVVTSIGIQTDAPTITRSQIIHISSTPTAAPVHCITKLAASTIFTTVDRLPAITKPPRTERNAPKYRKGRVPKIRFNWIKPDLEQDSIIDTSFKLRVVTMSVPCDFPSKDIFIDRYCQVLGALRNHEWIEIKGPREERIKQAMLSWGLDASLIENKSFLGFTDENADAQPEANPVDELLDQQEVSTELSNSMTIDPVEMTTFDESRESSVVEPLATTTTTVQPVEIDISSDSSEVAPSPTHPAIAPMATTTMALEATDQPSNITQTAPTQSSTSDPHPTIVQRPFQSSSAHMATATELIEMARQNHAARYITAQNNGSRQLPESESESSQDSAAHTTNTPATDDPSRFANVDALPNGLDWGFEPGTARGKRHRGRGGRQRGSYRSNGRSRQQRDQSNNDADTGPGKRRRTFA